jgi:hypothetical protein
MEKNVLDPASTDFTTTDTGILAEMVMDYLGAEAADCHTNIVRTYCPLNCFDGESTFLVDACDPDATYRVRVERVPRYV